MADTYSTSRERLFVRLKEKLVKNGREAVSHYTGRPVDTDDEKRLGQILDETYMDQETFENALKEYGLMPHYSYTGPVDSLEDGWRDNHAYRRKERKAPTGSIHLVYPEIEMLCRVADDPAIPGFLISCKDENGISREFHVYYNPGGSLRVCTSFGTSQRLSPEDVIRKDYPVPFVDVNNEPYAGKGETDDTGSSSKV